MTATVIALFPEPPVNSALDFVAVEAGIGGQVFVTVIDGLGDPVELCMTAGEAALLCGLIADAVEIAEGVARAP